MISLLVMYIDLTSWSRECHIQSVQSIGDFNLNDYVPAKFSSNTPCWIYVCEALPAYNTQRILDSPLLHFIVDRTRDPYIRSGSLLLWVVWSSPDPIPGARADI